MPNAKHILNTAVLDVTKPSDSSIVGLSAIAALDGCSITTTMRGVLQLNGCVFLSYTHISAYK